MTAAACIAATRRNFLGGGAALLAALPAWAADDPSPTNAKSRLILLGTGGGPTPKQNRSAPAQVLVVNGVSSPPSAMCSLPISIPITTRITAICSG